MLAHPKDTSLLSVRDLKGEHLPLLKSILTNGYQTIQQKYALPQHKIRCYFHYLPTYWLLHVHFVHVDKQGEDTRENVNLEQVINNLEMNPKYYQQCTMVYTVGDKHDLCKALMKEGIIEEYTAPEKESEWEDESSINKSQIVSETTSVQPTAEKTE